LSRALIHFDVAGALLEHALIDRAFVSLYQTSNSNVSSHTISLHRILEDWSEGPAFSSGGGGAAAAGPGDVTWLHTDHDLGYWVQAGGNFVVSASASEAVGGTGFYAWQSGVKLVNAVRLWLHAPLQNFGIDLVKRDPETGTGTTADRLPEVLVPPECIHNFGVRTATVKRGPVSCDSSRA